MYEVMNDYPVHTKAVLIDDRLSVVGSYNLDMRSTYLGYRADAGHRQQRAESADP